MAQSIKELMNSFYQAGTLERITVRSEHRGEVIDLEETDAIEGVGLAGDHRVARAAKPDSKRQVTLIQAEHLLAVANMLGLDEAIDVKLTRRNLVVSGINLLALKDKQFWVGNALLEYSGLCHPCSRMEENLGKGGYNAMRGHGGITAKVINGGTLSQGASVQALFD